MKIELSDKLFLDLLTKKYNFAKNNNNKVEVKYDSLNDEELVDFFNRFARSEGLDERLILTEHGRLMSITMDGEIAYVTIQDLRNCLKNELE